ncbi:insulinase family protein [Dysgonomonas sp. Marseille-P4677]|uniref:M16 family metallopeptidase n=1 Tax=Dysgonomonas sp. Marseille-P4677 TaxID=2364790 RepID=UPI001911562A|nr:M16 family metallopeptidase [Dysgonomonas sp. Marseille-P4677]MBK5720528.1 insulinase family protein [Dysgonomonas sp. Marseille-P4677]
MRKSFILLALIAVVGIIKAQGPQKLPIDPQVRFGKLENGLTYYIRHNAYPEKRADFYIAQKVGSMQEEDNQAGLAHFLEHMAFNGTKNYPGKKTMLNYLETIGVKFGANVNAYTSFDETVYNLSDVPVVRQSIIDSCLLVLHDWSGFIALEDKQIDEERAVIKEEWRTRSGAQYRIWDKQLPVIFEGSKYADRMPIGKMEIVENFPYQTLKDYYNKWYRPDLQAIVIVGDIDVDAVEAQIKKMFADISKPVNPAERIYFPVPDNEEPIVSIATDPEAVNTQVTLFIKHDIIPAEVKETQAGLVVSFMKGMASRMLSDRLKEISQKADAPFAGSYAYDGNFFVSKTKDAWTTIALSKEGKVDLSLASLIRENERIRRFGFTDTEVERAKATFLQEYERMYNNRSKERNDRYVQEYVRSFIDGEGIPGIEYEYNFVKQFAPMINAQAVNAMVQQIINNKNIIITVTGPEKDGLKYPTKEELIAVFKATEAEEITPYAETVSNEPLVANLPASGKVVNTETDAKLGTTIWTLSNGMKVVIKKTDYKDDQILMSAHGYGGTSIVPDADINNANMASMVPYVGGIGNFSSTDLKKVLAGKSASVNANISSYTQGFNGSSTIKDIETLLQLTYLYFTSPRKDEGAYSTIMDMVKNQLKNLSADPSFVMGLEISKTMYGDNPRMKEMTLEDAEKLNYDRIIEIYKEVFANPGSFTLNFVGTVDEATLKPLVEQYLASLPSGNKDAKYKEFNATILKGDKKNVFEQEMKTPKSSVFELYSGTLKRNQKTQISLSALKQILDIVYMRTIRDEAGGTYGVRSQASISRIPDGQTKLQLTFDTDPDRVHTISPIIDREVKNIAENGPEDADFQKVKEYMIKKFQEDEKTNGYWVGILGSKYFYNEDNHSNYLSLVSALTKDDIKTLTKELISQGNFIEVIMNPKK